MDELREAARAVLTELDIIREHRAKSGVGFLVVHVDTHEDLRNALSAAAGSAQSGASDATLVPPAVATADKPLTGRDDRPLQRVAGEPCRFPDIGADKPYCSVHGGWWVYGFCDRAPIATTETTDAATPTALALDVERLRVVFHDEYEQDFGCQHKNQHRKAWDCWQRASEVAADYAALSPTTETPKPKPAKYCGHSWETDASVCPECGADWSGLL
jgi:hypothetical protein